MSANKKTKTALLLENVPAEKVFWCHDGRVFSNLLELEKALRDMSKETYEFHVNKEKNDFSNWINDVIGDSSLAKALRKIKNPKTAAEKIKARIDN